MAAITYGIFGPRNTYHGGGGGGGGYTEPTHHDSGNIFNETVYCDSEWHIVNEFTHIEVDSAAVRTLIVPTAEDERIRVCAQVPQGKSITVSANWDGDSLCIAAHPKSVSFEYNFTNGFDGLVGWLEDIFGDGNGIVITIEIPERILESFSLKQGSGTTVVRDINAASNYIEVGSGTVNFYGSGRYAQRMLYLDIGSGKVCVTNMLADYYDIDIGSGKFVVSGLKGYGKIDFGSGKGSVFYSEFGGKDNHSSDHDVDMGSGTLDMYLPEEASAYVNADVGSGYVNIDALGTNKKITSNNDEDVILIGSYSDSTGMLDIDMGSGSVNIYDSSDDALNSLIAEYAVEEPKIPPKSDDNAAVVESTTNIPFDVSSSSIPDENSDGESGDTTVSSSSEDVPNVPEAPDAPNPPEVPDTPDAPNPPEIEQAA